jgi:hypothetical protein
MAKDEKRNLHADFYDILNKWMNYFCQLLSVHGVNDGRQTEIHTAEPLVPEPCSFEFEIALEKLKRYKLPGTDQIPAELIQVEGNILCSEIHKFVDSIWKKEELPEQWKESNIVSICKRGNTTNYSNFQGISEYHFLK